MLSIVDLLKDNTLNLEMASFLLSHMLNNSSFLTAANPNGAGKTTLMGSMLNLLKPNIKIKTIDKNIPQSKPKEKYLVHEIGSGPYYSYLWGKKARQFFSLTENSTIASCLHADRLEEMKNVLFNKLGVTESHFSNLDLILFMKKKRHVGKMKRRVSFIYEINDSIPKLIYRWDEDSDTFENLCNPKINVKSEHKNFIRGIKQNNIVRLKQIRKELMERF